jgi:CheY-like chemotaxis protein
MPVSFLIIDDDTDDIDMFREALGEVDNEIECWSESDAQQALDVLLEYHAPYPNVIFLDVNMPSITGWDVLEKLKKRDRTRHIPIVMYSTSSHRRDIDKSVQMGADYFLVKPSVYSTLKNQLQQIIRHVRNGIPLGHLRQ